MVETYQDNQEVNEWIKFGMRVAISTAFHPFEYAKVLMQLGYEPIPGQPGRTLLGQRALILPNVFQYVKYIGKMDGFVGCYRGLGPKLVGMALGTVGSEKIAIKFGLEALPVENQTKDDEISEEQLYRSFERDLKRELVLHVSGIVITHPFHVISVRMMAQFIGNETTYKSLWSSIREIWNHEGIFGFFSGLTPKLLFDVSILVLASSTTYIITKYYIRDRTNQPYLTSFAQFLYSTIMYPLSVVGTCMQVTGSRLTAGNPPYMPIYNSWVHCYRDLNNKGDLKRGSSLFWRYQHISPIFKTAVPFPKISRKSM